MRHWGIIYYWTQTEAPPGQRWPLHAEWHAQTSGVREDAHLAQPAYRDWLVASHAQAFFGAPRSPNVLAKAVKLLVWDGTLGRWVAAGERRSPPLGQRTTAFAWTAPHPHGSRYARVLAAGPERWLWVPPGHAAPGTLAGAPLATSFDVLQDSWA